MNKSWNFCELLFTTDLVIIVCTYPRTKKKNPEGFYLGNARYANHQILLKYDHPAPLYIGLSRDSEITTKKHVHCIAHHIEIME